MWAAGVIMFWLVAGKHPYWKSGMDREEYKLLLN
jgi:hypothetical protein